MNNSLERSIHMTVYIPKLIIGIRVVAALAVLAIIIWLSASNSDMKKGAVIMLLLIFFLIWSIIGTILGFILKVIFHILPIKTIIALCLIGYALHMLGIHFL